MCRYLKEPQGLGQGSDLLFQGEDAGDHFWLLAGLLLQVHGAPSPLHTFQETMQKCKRGGVTCEIMHLKTKSLNWVQCTFLIMILLLDVGLDLFRLSAATRNRRCMKSLWRLWHSTCRASDPYNPKPSHFVTQTDVTTCTPHRSRFLHKWNKEHWRIKKFPSWGETFRDKISEKYLTNAVLSRSLASMVPNHCLTLQMSD